MQCATHPSVETQIRCSRCEKAICPRCMVGTPVGYRCRECAQVRKHPALTVNATEGARAVVAAVGMALLGGVAWAIVERSGIGFLLIVAAIGIGYAVSEVVSLAGNRKRAPSLPVLAGISVIASFLIGNVLYVIFWTPFGWDVALRARNVLDFSIWGALSVLLAAAIAVTRLRN